MPTLSYGKLPTVEQIEKDFPKDGYPMELSPCDFKIVSDAINQGIDAHLEAIFFDQFAASYGKQGVIIRDTKSLQVLMRRLMEAGDKKVDDDLDLELEYDLVNCILSTLEIEWV